MSGLLHNSHDLILARYLLQLWASHPQSIAFKSRKKKGLLIAQLSLLFFFFFKSGKKTFPRNAQQTSP